MADGTVFVGSLDDSVYALDADDGSQLWAFQTGGNVSSSPTVADRTVFVGSTDTSVYALDAGVAGSSEGSRVMLRTLGRHENRSDHVRTVAPPHFDVTIADTTDTEAGENLDLAHA